MLCDDLDGWHGGWDGKEVQEGGVYVCMQLIRFIV